MTKKNKSATVAVIAVVLLVALIYVILDKTTVNLAVGTEVQTPEYNNAQQMKAVSSVVVKVKATEEKSPYKIVIGENFEKSYTKTVAEVTEVIQGELNAGDKITVMEEYEEKINEGLRLGKTLTVSGLYTPMKPGLEYILFLSWAEEHNGYWIVLNHMGKVNLDGKDKLEAKQPYTDADKALRNDIISTMK